MALQNCQEKGYANGTSLCMVGILVHNEFTKESEMRGYYGIVLYQPKGSENWGTVMRSAFNFEANFIATIGRRHPKMASDTVKASRSIPTFHYATIDDFLNALPVEAILVPVEVDGRAELSSFCHPVRAVYIFGGEDRTLPTQLMEYPRAQSVHIQTRQCLNLAVAASIVMYDRTFKGTR